MIDRISKRFTPCRRFRPQGELKAMIPVTVHIPPSYCLWNRWTVADMAGSVLADHCWNFGFRHPYSVWSRKPCLERPQRMLEVPKPQFRNLLNFAWHPIRSICVGLRCASSFLRTEIHSLDPQVCREVKIFLGSTWYQWCGRETNCTLSIWVERIWNCSFSPSEPGNRFIWGRNWGNHTEALKAVIEILTVYRCDRHLN